MKGAPCASPCNCFLKYLSIQGKLCESKVLPLSLTTGAYYSPPRAASLPRLQSRVCQEWSWLKQWFELGDLLPRRAPPLSNHVALGKSLLSVTISQMGVFITPLTNC